jgi:hypothetical protein
VGGLSNAALPEPAPEPRKRLEKRGDSHLSAARIVRKHALTESTSRSEKCLGARLERRLARSHNKNTCQYYDTLAGKIPQPISMKDPRNYLDDHACQ